jgi:hypothetical protein
MLTDFVVASFQSAEGAQYNSQGLRFAPPLAIILRAFGALFGIAPINSTHHKIR